MSALFKKITSNHTALLADMKNEPAARDMDTARRWADALRRGSIFFCGGGEVRIGLSNVDWSGSHLAHQEWPANLNRFQWLQFLVEVHAAGEGDDLPGMERLEQADASNNLPRHTRPRRLDMRRRVGELFEGG